MNKTILYTGAFRFPIGDAAAARVLNNAKILRELGYDVVFISFGGEAREEDKQSDGQYYYHGFRYILSNDIDLPRTNIIKRIIRFVFSGRNALKIINNDLHNVHAIIAYQPSSYFTKKLLAICKNDSIQLITDLTEWYSPNEFPGGAFAPPAWLNEWNMRVTQKRVKSKIIISSFLNHFYHDSNNAVLPPLTDSKEDKWNVYKEVMTKFDGVRIIYAGTPGKKDALEKMLDAVIHCLNNGLKLQFIVLGVKKEEISHYKNSKEITNFSENIILCGRVPQTEIPSYYYVSDFSLLIREHNRKNKAGFPTKFVESNTAGCPVIVNDTSDVSIFVENGVNGFLIPDFSLMKIIATLVKVAQLPPETIASMKISTKEKALKNFDFRTYIEEIKKIIQKNDFRD
jgi:glycosyltransferase involved in cell wall biosynthesis